MGSGASELGDLEGSGTLVLIQELAELATSTDGGRLTVVGKLGDTTELGTSATVDTHLLGAVGGNLAGHDGDLTREASLEVLNSGGHTVEGGSERLASVADVTLGLGTGTGDVLHSVGETVVSESSLPGDLLVDLVDSTTHGGISVGAVLGELLVGLAELSVGTLLGLGHGSLEGGQDSHLAGSRGIVGTTDGSSGTLAGGIDLGGKSSNVGLHGSLDSTSVGTHLVGVGSDVAVGLGHLLGSLGLKRKHGAVEARHSVAEGALGSLGGGAELAGNGSTGSSTATGSSSLVAGNLVENSLGHADRGLEVVLGLSGSGTDSEKHLLLHLSTSVLGLETEVLDGATNVGSELGDLGSDTHVEGSLGLGRHVGEALLNLSHAVLTVADSTGNGIHELGAVGLHHGSEHGTTLAGLDSVLVDNASQALHLAIELTVVADNGGVELGHALAELALGIAEGISDIETSTTRLVGELAVHAHLVLLLLGDGRVQLGGLAGEHAGSMSAVATHDTTDLGDLVVVVGSHGIHTSDGLGLVARNETLELTVTLEVGLVAVVTELDHTLGLGIHVGIDLGLLELVLLDDTRELGNTSVGLGDPLLNSGTELEDVHLELGLGSSDLAGGLSLGSGDVAHSGRKATVVEGRERVEGSLHARSRRLECHVSVGAVAGHTGASLAELRGSGGDDLLQLVGCPGTEGLILTLELSSELGATLLGELTSTSDLAVVLGNSIGEGLASDLGILLNLGSVGRHVFVGLGNAGIGSRAEGSHGTLLSEHSNTELVGSAGLVAGNTSKDELVAADVDPVTPVGKLGSPGETVLDVTHGASEVLAGTLSVGGHLGEKGRLQLPASSLVEREVTVHLGTHSGDVALASALLRVNLPLDVLEVVRQAHAAIGGVGHDSASLLHISACHGCGSTHGGRSLWGTKAANEHRLWFFLAIRSEVDHCATDRQGTHNHNC